jgi:hypothetical protein
MLTTVATQVSVIGSGAEWESAAEAVGTTIAILPGENRSAANPWADHVVVTGMGHARNLAVAASGEAVIAVGGSYGTIAEMALALRLGRPVVALVGAPEIEGTIAAASPAEAVELALRDLG